VKKTSDEASWVPADVRARKAFEKFNREIKKTMKPRKPKSAKERAEREAAIDARASELVAMHSARSLAVLVAELEADAGVLEGWDL
jgi:hypothetical protein